MIDLAQFKSPEFDRGASRLKEISWALVRGAFFLNRLPLPSWFRVSLLRAFGAKIGDRVIIRSRVSIYFPWKLSIDDDVWISDEVTLIALDPIEIKKDVCLSQRVFLCTGSDGFDTEDGRAATASIRISDRSWLAANVFVGPGVLIRESTFVAADSVVVGDTWPHSRVGGNPARPIK